MLFSPKKIRNPDPIANADSMISGMVIDLGDSPWQCSDAGPVFPLKVMNHILNM
jgi:hypothetical protein